MKFLDIPMQVKALDESGTFEGYASVFGNVDLGGDVIDRGAFKEIVKNDDGQVTVLWQHSTRDPIGVAEVHQDDVGLRFKARLVMEDPMARKAYAHMKAKSARGMSIGYDVLDGGYQMLQSGVRLLKELKLWEISVVTFGMNPAAGVDGVKAAQIVTVRDFEEFLRDAGFSKARATQIASSGFKSLQARRESGDAGEVVQEMIDFLSQFPKE